MSEAHETLAADVLIIGAGPAGLSCALRVAQLIQQHNQTQRLPRISPDNIYVVEKGRDLGTHQLSGAILDPRALFGPVPNFAESAPFDTPVTGDAPYFLTSHRAWKCPWCRLPCAITATTLFLSVIW